VRDELNVEVSESEGIRRVAISFTPVEVALDEVEEDF
jgi:hypothetical protein